MVIGSLVIMLCTQLQLSTSWDNQEECSNGWIVFGFCLEECPSGFIKVQNTCVYNNEEIINIEFSQYSSHLTTYKNQHDKVDDEESTLPIYTYSRGAFFLSDSIHSIEKFVRLAPRFTLQLWMYGISPGQIFGSNEEVLGLFLNETSLAAKYINSSNGVIWENAWVNVIWSLEFYSFGGSVFSLFSNEVLDRISSNEDFNLNPLKIQLGK